jgi:predicted O-methyltransferase YrrM
MFYYGAFKYLKYKLLSRHKKGHGIHSPFIFDLVSRVFRNKIDPRIVLTVETTRQKMIADRRSIKVHDLGSRSEFSGNTEKKVSYIARKSPVSSKYGAFLSNMATEFGRPFMLELGTSLGISTMYMAASCEDSLISTIEGSSEIAAIARQNFTDAGLSNITLLEGSFDEVLPRFAAAKVKPGLIFIDGNHRKEPVLKYFNDLAMISDSSTVIIIDDINYSKEMAEAWEEIKQNEKVSVTIDIFRMGILFFREGINHKDYIIRY